MDTNITIFCTIFFIALVTSIYLLIRNFKVCDFLMKLLQKSEDSDTLVWSQRLKVIKSLSYEKILFSFKPLKYKYWLTPEQMKLFKMQWTSLYMK